MKVEIEASKAEPRKYPYLGIFRVGSFVVLFDTPSVGTVVWTTLNGSHPVGHHSTNWEETEFNPFEGKIILSND